VAAAVAPMVPDVCAAALRHATAPAADASVAPGAPLPPPLGPGRPYCFLTSEYHLGRRFDGQDNDPASLSLRVLQSWTVDCIQPFYW